RFRKGRAGDVEEGRTGLIALEMDRTGDQPLAGAGLTADEDRARATLRDALHQLADLLGLRRRADQVLDREARAVDRLVARDLGAQAHRLERLLRVEHQLVEVEGLL